MKSAYGFLLVVDDDDNEPWTFCPAASYGKAIQSKLRKTERRRLSSLKVQF